MAPFMPPTSRNIFAGVLVATSAGDPASTAINTAATPLGLVATASAPSRRLWGAFWHSFGLCVTMNMLS